MKTIAVLGGAMLFLCAEAWEIREPGNPTAAEKTAAAELKHYLNGSVRSFRLGGRELGNIYVGNTAFAEKHGLVSGSLPDEKWVILSIENDLILTGGGSRGIIYAAYKFLEDVIGVRFFAANQEYVPQKQDYSFASLNLSGKPFFRWRCIYKGGEYPRDGGRSFAQRLINDYTVRGKYAPDQYGGTLAYAPRQLHNFSLYLPPAKYLKAHPEFYALRNGRRVPDQLCLSSRPMRAEFLKNLKKLIAEQNAVSRRKGTEKTLIYNIAQNDNRNKCLCPQCTAFSRRHGDSGLLLDFLNELSREITAMDPELQIRTYAYTHTVEAPRDMKAAPNIMVLLCNTHGSNHLTGESVKFPRLLNEWSKVVRQLHVHEYEILFLQHPECPWPSEFSFPAIFRLWKENHVTGVNIEQEDYYGSDMADLKFYLLSKFMEDPVRKDFDLLMEDFCMKYYGAAGEEMLQYRRTLKRLADHAGTRISWLCGSSAGHNRYIALDDMLSLQSLFDRAEGKVRGNPQLMERLGRARLALDWQLGFELFRDYRRAWKRSSSGKAFPIDLKAVRERALKNFKNASAIFSDPKFSRFKFIQEKNPDAGESEKFRGIRHHDIASFEMQGRLTGDPGAETGAALLEENAKPSFGIYDVMGKRNFSGMTYPDFPKDRIKGEGYHWYKVAAGTLSGQGAGCNLILTSSWASRVALAHLDGIDYGKPVEIWARFKVEGPTYGIKNESGKDTVFLDRVVLLNVRDTQGIRREAEMLCRQQKHRESVAKYLEVSRYLEGRELYDTICRAGYCLRLHLNKAQEALDLSRHIPDPCYAKGYRLEILQWSSPEETIGEFAGEDFSRWPEAIRANAYLRRGNAFFKQKNTIRAEEDLQKAYELGKSFGKWIPVQLLGDLYREQKNDPAKAEEYYRMCMTHFPKGFPAYLSALHLSRLLIRQGKAEEAFRVMEESQATGIYRAEMLAEKAGVYQARGEMEKAAGLLREALEQNMHASQKRRFEKMLKNLNAQGERN